jgi:hypothetical protein
MVGVPFPDEVCFAPGSILFGFAVSPFYQAFTSDTAGSKAL